MNRPVLMGNDIIYHILIDRFAGFPDNPAHPSTEFIGGTIQGIIDKLSYLKNLGITVLWISPFYKTSAYHGYHITDYYSVDPHFGSEDDVVRLIHKVHEMDMRIIADFVPNHCSKYHPFFQDAQKISKSEYKNWFYFVEWPHRYLRFLSVDDLPKINLSFPPARDHVINAALFWLEKGFDGFRLDHVIGPSSSFWNQFVHAIKKKHPRTVLMGEAWMQGISFKELRTICLSRKYLKWLFGSSSDWLLKSYIGILDGVLDFTGQQMIQNALNAQITKTQLERKLKHHYRSFPKQYLLPLFLDNHDMDRFLFLCGNDKEQLKKTAQLQFSTPQPVIIYYGTEIGMTQMKSIWSMKTHGDSLARQPMTWNKIDVDLLDFYKTLIAKKKNNKKTSLQ